MDIKLMDIVGRRSYNCDILFRVIDVRKINDQKFAVLYGEDFRLVADAPYEDLVVIDDNQRVRLKNEYRTLEEQSFKLFKQDVELIKNRQEYEATGGYVKPSNYFQMPGKVLHLDGDPSYLKKCMTLYEKVGIPVLGIHCNEKEMPEKIGELIDLYRPDILVITGHDAYSKAKGKMTDINAYRHSKHFVQTVKEARKKIPHLDQLVIFAGACQSHFESLIHAGANYASSPSRINIHALDPVYIVAKISFTPFMERINVWDVLKNTLTGEKGLGGIETRGVLRTGMPYRPIQEEDE
ncbi:sporulation peptidase YabG [Bacillus sp. ISL-40]|uniref:sporulation peptidase YabG n=1 Tax=unclassified Bacillus (in: firmicutes) TaxID=185979 RepID=UPI001BE606F7|nr:MULTISPECIES: sporulation peptidase YabG [unclassified Bacillus (in: firmicutes)]MBT2699398.1 sporulation peptidase YabG [Bacillus sp. ISL-40]MBT2720081.1 sporulation peptidase YabG [Bacillus sp. ISL-46]MBT2729743.1 sporulation peptidase YabG [Bacillus sp. ISL-75]MBT2743625.1 sporulation peptidase YabG [Bacillus sp. ISL-77]